MKPLTESERKEVIALIEADELLTEKWRQALHRKWAYYRD